MIDEQRYCQTCNLQLDSDEGINAQKDFVIFPKHLDQGLPEVFYDQSIKRLYFCSVKCFFEFMMGIWEKSKKVTVEQKQADSTEKEENE